MSTLTPHLIADAMSSTCPYVQPAEGWACVLSFEANGAGVVTVHLTGEQDGDLIESRRFRLVEVHTPTARVEDQP